jgi:hypothetical protein
MCLCGGTGRYRVSAVIKGIRCLVWRGCTCPSGIQWQYGVTVRHLDPEKSVAKVGEGD